MFLGTLTLKPDREATLSSLLLPAHCQDRVLFLHLLQDLLVPPSSEAHLGDHRSDGWSLSEKV